MNPMDLTGRRVLVTGASSGIGRAVAVLVSRLGGQVICVGRNAQELEKTRAELAGTGHQVERRDLDDVAGIPAWMVEVADRAGALDGLVHAAGLESIAPLGALTLEHLRAVLRINAEAAVALAKGFRHRQVHAGAGGSLVFISSAAGRVGIAGSVAYCLSKGGLEAAVRALALELAPQRIRVNVVAPGLIRTRMYEEMDRMWTEEQRAALERAHPLGIGRPEDVANAAAFLLADTARWITGATLAVDGGYTAQ